jgi:hypothetical protein
VAWAGIYLRGLLADMPRKNVETIARELSLDLAGTDRNPVQALQHFLNQSTWDEQVVLARYRDRLVRPALDGEGALVLDEVAFAKRGRHSVGVQRQFSDTLGGKINCQVALLAEYVSTAAYLPLMARLYLPERWLAAPEQLDRASVPAECRIRRGRAELVLDLLRQLLAENLGVGLILTRLPQRASHPVLDYLQSQPVPFLALVTEDLPVEVLGPITAFPEAGPSAAALAGTSVPEVHSVGAIARELAERPPAGTDALYGIPIRLPTRATDRAQGEESRPLWLVLRLNQDGDRQGYVGMLRAGCTRAILGRYLQWSDQVRRQRQELITTLGWDHFEGRSWRGFHHHACLVMLAHGWQYFRG